MTCKKCEELAGLLKELADEAHELATEYEIMQTCTSPGWKHDRDVFLVDTRAAIAKAEETWFVEPKKDEPAKGE